jgi:hypothetical protein
MAQFLLYIGIVAFETHQKNNQLLPKDAEFQLAISPQLKVSKSTLQFDLFIVIGNLEGEDVLWGKVCRIEVYVSSRGVCHDEVALSVSAKCV